MVPDRKDLTFNEYQRLSKETAIFPVVDAELADACLKFLSSAARIAGVIKKIYRDNQGTITPEIKLKLDAAMMVASEDFDVLDFLLEQGQSKRSGSAPSPALVYPLLGYADEVGELIEKCLDGDFEGAEKECGDTQWYSAQIATGLGVQSGETASANLQKLFSRKERGVLQGSGDNR